MISTEWGGHGRVFLRHAVATLGYRGGKVLRGAPEPFGAFTIGETSRNPPGILPHIGDLLDWALSLARGEQVWHESAANSRSFAAWQGRRFAARITSWQISLQARSVRTRRRPAASSINRTARKGVRSLSQDVQA
jgi:hypothetical protein